ncbi:MAG: hypothetical protein K1X89_21925 [Myxococcaceae bacterium]|nr:hypothetical protein [Myxococcaceae bacterium]
MCRASIAALVLLAAGCWPALPSSTEGFACRTDADCRGELRCASGQCRAPADGDAGADAGPATDGGQTDGGLRDGGLQDGGLQYGFDGGACAASGAFPNQVTNGTFETDTSGWEGYPAPSDAQLTRTSPGLLGSGAARADRTSAATEFGINDKPNWISSTTGPGKTVCVLAWARGQDPSGKLRLRVREYTAGGSQTGPTRTSILESADGQWHPLATDVVLSGPAGSKLDLQVEIIDPSQSTAWLEVDEVSMRQLP